MSHPYDRLSPDRVLDAIESAGFLPSGHVPALGSYENRVYQVGIEDSPPVIAKFYRPERWDEATILEEHAFSSELAAAEIPVVAPLARAGHTLFEHAGFRFALFPRQGGRAPEPGDLDQLEWIGRFLGRIHQAGSARPFRHRPALEVHRYGHAARAAVLESPLLPNAFRERYAGLSQALLDTIDEAFREIEPAALRLHGDCHHGNILWTDSGPHFVDLDDCCQGPAMQDLWMLLHGDRHEMTGQLDALLEGYRVFRDFDLRELALIEPLRSLRLIHYTGWLCRRWDDPAFPRAFPWLAEANWWEGHLNDLEQQGLRMAEPPLQLY
ncbi:serine/threonine protein kinase [endosymbiont of unidentified scaly snail isolate Monju]|uniref:serine/threonine protein kinase n=1 Tax=endosymbiont of unidentified scaly snail isolate Monju TaxID=1248727 RepID=UPI0003891FC6|nr:serine/threonine protein kinase [endosymbiont of unidentified scaly snail isolate Monju]BAN69745.1 serine/threonine protein kinase [endosymbiont of unidentified scaly snail isolate Monju]